MEKVMLSFDKVSAHYGKIQALHEVSLQIKQGEIVTLMAIRVPAAGVSYSTGKILPTGTRRKSCAKR